VKKAQFTVMLTPEDRYRYCHVGGCRGRCYIMKLIIVKVQRRQRLLAIAEH